MLEPITVSAVIATYARPRLLEVCLTSLANAARLAGSTIRVDLIIAINGSDSASSHLVSSRDWGLPLQILELERLTPAAARNRCLPLTTGKWVYFIDDDAFVETEFFCCFLDRLEKQRTLGQEPSVVGGPNLTPKNSNAFQRASGAALASRFGSFYSSSRYAKRLAPTTPCGDEALILCNLFVRRDALVHSRFPENFVCNEENWLLQGLTKKGHVLLHEPELYVWHERRPLATDFARQVHRYGIGRGQNLRNRPHSFRWPHVTPALCLVFTALTLSIAVVISAVESGSRYDAKLLTQLDPTSQTWPVIWLAVWIALFGLYSAIAVAAAIRLHLRVAESFRICVLSTLLFPLIHLAYASGVLRGLSRSALSEVRSN